MFTWDTFVVHLAIVEVKFLHYRSTREHKMLTANSSHMQSYTACAAKKCRGDETKNKC